MKWSKYLATYVLLLISQSENHFFFAYLVLAWKIGFAKRIGSPWGVLNFLRRDCIQIISTITFARDLVHFVNLHVNSGLLSCPLQYEIKSKENGKAFDLLSSEQLVQLSIRKSGDKKVLDFLALHDLRSKKVQTRWLVYLYTTDPRKTTKPQ